MLIDTDVMVWVLRRHPPAVREVEALNDRAISVITYMELLQGGRGKEHIRTIKQYLAEYYFEVRPLTENIGHRASLYMEMYCPTAGFKFGDALIAATAVENNLKLLSANHKHFRAIPGLDLKVFRPLRS